LLVFGELAIANLLLSEIILIYKLPQTSREEIEQMLDLSELKPTKVYQEAKKEDRLEAILETVPDLLSLGVSVEQIAEKFGLELETLRQAA
jgi:predicted transposase/invertase (TIGR01784 family)